ncbi:MAG: T9SS type A sorting domain-containing protein [Bacteroidia bacterium]
MFGNTYRIFIWLIGLIIFLPLQTLATHVLGADMHWESIGKDTFKLSLNIYRDCNGVNQDSTYIDLKSTCRTERVLAKLVSKTDITPLCKGVKSRCSNPTSSFNYGIEKVEMSAIFTTTNFINDGCCEIQLIVAQCCRSNSIVGTGFPLYLKSTINACLSGNLNSPKFLNEPLNLICLNNDFSYSFKVAHNDFDSIRYELVPSLIDSATSFKYENGFDYYKPMSFLGFPKVDQELPKGFHFNGITGQLDFRPTKPEIKFLAIKVKAFLQGEIINEIARDITATVIKCQDNEPPKISGIACTDMLTSNFKIETLPNKLLQFNFCISDSFDNDSVWVKWQNEIPGSKIEVTDSANGQFQFRWTPVDSNLRKEPYTFTVYANDNSCPMKGHAVKTYSINVRRFVSIEDYGHSISVYPNPTKNQLTILTNKPGHFELFGSNGKLVYAKTLEQKRSYFNLSHLDKGIYVYHFKTHSAIYSGKLILKN